MSDQEEKIIPKHDIANRRPDMSDINSIACSIHDVIEKHFGEMDDMKSDLVYDEITGVLETGLKPDDYPSHN
jgi:hypothetical protein